MPGMPPGFPAFPPPGLGAPPQFQNGGSVGAAQSAAEAAAAAARRRAPLPDQNEMLLEEMRQGRYRKAR
jgi:polyadenylation factor subunit 2